MVNLAHATVRAWPACRDLQCPCRYSASFWHGYMKNIGVFEFRRWDFHDIASKSGLLRYVSNSAGLNSMSQIFWRYDLSFFIIFHWFDSSQHKKQCPETTPCNSVLHSRLIRCFEIFQSHTVELKILCTGNHTLIKNLAKIKTDPRPFFSIRFFSVSIIDRMITFLKVFSLFLLPNILQSHLRP